MIYFLQLGCNLFVHLTFIAYEDYEAGLKVLNELTEEYQLKVSRIFVSHINTIHL